MSAAFELEDYRAATELNGFMRPNVLMFRWRQFERIDMNVWNIDKIGAYNLFKKLSRQFEAGSKWYGYI